MTELLLIKDKYGTHVMEGEADVRDAAFDLLKERLGEGYWYENWDEGRLDTQYEDRAHEIINMDDADAALDFLLERARDGFEYEHVEVTRSR